MPDPRASTDQRGAKPPHGFDVMTCVELDPEHGRADRWLYHGRVGRRSCIRAGFKSRAAACHAAWLAFDGACAVLAHGPTGAGMRAMQAATRWALTRGVDKVRTLVRLRRHRPHAVPKLADPPESGDGHTTQESRAMR